jgi:hypothetical protein
MRNFAVLVLMLALSACAHAKADPVPAASNSDMLLKAKKAALHAHQIVEQLKDLPDDQFVAKYHRLGVNDDTYITEEDWETGNWPRADIDALTADINHEMTDVKNLLADGFEPTHPRLVSMRAEIAMKEKQRHPLIEQLKHRLVVEAQAADARVKTIEATPQQVVARDLRARVRWHSKHDLWLRLSGRPAPAGRGLPSKLRPLTRQFHHALPSVAGGSGRWRESARPAPCSAARRACQND